ncbi:Oidioi.mRNA.OKI2018_I69.XSR.g14513.t1.cds [Oikopleura dioica]|uniref:Oidioi.mRNA.OKI2018_I69.XSR.g14513.t1.cds n=1 Tax=Oikopleura dioica TaxID=34765 RepID=A0ABN7SF12_OIKDI|nr:Oidioi.mRNA.OKI2018_I69.XSR.g14513.t1.cds [Oikopleura dioica]
MKFASLLVGASHAVPLENTANKITADKLDEVTILKSGDAFTVSGSFETKGGITAACSAEWALSLQVAIDGDRILEAQVDKGNFKYRQLSSFEELLPYGIAHIKIDECSSLLEGPDGTAPACSIVTDSTKEVFTYEVGIEGLTVDDSGKEISLQWNCDTELEIQPTILEVWQEGELTQSIGTTDLSSDMNATIVAACAMQNELPKANDITFSIGGFEQVVEVDENGTAQLNVTGSDLLQYGGKNIHDQPITCSASQIASNGALLKSYDMTSIESVEFRYPTTYARISVDGVKEYQSKSYLAKGSQAKVSCDADGFPKPELDLTANGLDLNNNVLTEKTDFKCVANGIEDVQTVDIFYLEDVQVAHDGKTDEEPLYEGRDVTFSCSARSNPPASFSLVKDGQVFSDHGERDHTIEAVSGIFTCAASLPPVFGINNVESTGATITAEPAPEEGSGRAIIIVSIVIIVVCLIGAVGFFVWKKKQADKGEEVPQDEEDAQDDAEE